MGGSGSGDNKEEGKEETSRQINGKRLKHDGIVALLCLIMCNKTTYTCGPSNSSNFTCRSILN